MLSQAHSLVFFFGLPLRNNRNISRTLFERSRGWGEPERAAVPCSPDPARALSDFRRLSLRATSWKQPGALLLSFNASLSQGYPRALFFCRYFLYTSLEWVTFQWRVQRANHWALHPPVYHNKWPLKFRYKRKKNHILTRIPWGNKQAIMLTFVSKTISKEAMLE